MASNMDSTDNFRAFFATDGFEGTVISIPRNLKGESPMC